jgi:hypothetical protein
MNESRHKNGANDDRIEQDTETNGEAKLSQWNQWQ